MLHGKPNKKILEELNEVVYGHEQAKKALIALVNRSKIRHYQKWGLMLPDDELLKPGKCLLLGNSGTGKTFLVQTLSKLVSFPFLIVDASSFNPTGAGGGVKPATLKTRIQKKAKEYLENREGTYFSIEGVIDQMVVFVDEFDKISSKYNGGSGNWNEQIQSHFLTIFENSGDLSGVTWIFAGAFSGIEASAKRTNFGFTSEQSKIERKDVTDEDVIKYGMIPELVGRLTTICPLDRLTEDDYYNILIEMIIPKKLNELLYFNIQDIDINEAFLRQISKEAAESNQGIRYLYRELDRHLLDCEFNYETCKISSK